MKITDKFPMRDGKYLCLENNKTYTNPRTITNLLFEKYNMTAFEYAIKWNLIGDDDYIRCKICGSACDSIGKHLSVKHKGYGGIEQYKKQYGEDVELLSKTYNEHLTNKMLGENNHNHTNNTTELERQQKSPFSIEFWKLKYPNKTDKQLNKLLLSFRDSALSDREFDTRLEYYLKRGYTEDEGLELIKKRQTTFSKEICIEKYGEVEGLKRWNDRQELWIKNYPKLNYSKISQVLFKELYESIKNDFCDIYFAILNNDLQYDESGKNYEYYLRLNNIVIKPDFFIKDIKKIIEFDGTYYHRTTNENKKREELRDLEILESGYEVLHISEYDFKTNKKEVIDKCLNFIYDK